MQKLILLVDNDRDEFIILNQAIEMANLEHICIWANDIDRAEALLHEMIPDLIFIDYNMPKVNGIDCLKRLRRLNALREVPIVLYSNHITDVNRELALTQGASCFQKPDSLSDLVNYLIKLTSDKALCSLTQENGVTNIKK